MILGFSISLTSSIHSSVPDENDVLLSSSMSLKLRLSLEGMYSDPESTYKSSEEELLLT